MEYCQIGVGATPFDFRAIGFGSRSHESWFNGLILEIELPNEEGQDMDWISAIPSGTSATFVSSRYGAVVFERAFLKSQYLH